VTELFTAFGEKGTPAERVALQAWSAAEQYLAAGVPVGEHLSDQLLLPLGIGAHQGSGGGEFRTTTISQHTETHIAVLKQFLNVRIDVQREESGGWKVCVS
jgi:RNA 3'-terminal phosphate cyclase (ATP)